LKRLLGAQVFNLYITLNAKQKLDFLDLLAVAKGVQEKEPKVKKRKAEKS
jgi:hypothetical protein